MPYSYRIFDSIRQVPAADWQVIRETDGEPFNEPEYLQLVEETLGRLTQTAVLVCYDESGRAAAGACLSTCPLDVVLQAAPWIRRTVGWVRRVWPNFLRLKTVLSGVPTAVEQETLLLRSDANRGEVLRLLAEAAATFARRRRAALTVLGDFCDGDADWLNELERHGYRRGSSAPSHFLDMPYHTFDEYLLAMRSCYRTDVQHDMRLLDRRRVQIEVLDLAAKRAEPITPEFYEFYLQLLRRVELQFVTLPRTFFNRFIALNSERLQVLRVYVDQKPAGFFLSIEAGDHYHMLHAAVDEARSQELGIYRNLYFHEIEAAQARGLRQIRLGSMVDEFKLRIGSRPHGRIVYVKVRGLLQVPFRLFAKYLLSERPALTPKRVFRENRITRPPKLRKVA